MSKSNIVKSIVIMLILSIISASPILLFLVCMLNIPDPPAPEITYAEFPFCITYEVDGEIKTYEDVIICEYAGIESWGTAGKYRKWSKKLMSGNKYITLLKSKTNELSFEISVPIPGLPEYYMGDFRQSKTEYERTMKDRRYLGYKQWEDGVQTSCSITKEEAWEKYHIKIIDQQYSQPIENKFIDK